MPTTLLAALVAALLVAAAAPARADDAAPAPVKPLLVLSGADSRTAQPTFARATDEAAFAKLWLGHLGKTADDAFREQLPTIEIDFAKCMVVAVFAGTTTNCRGLTIASVTDGPDAVTVRFEKLTYQTAGPLNGGPAPVNHSTPYAFVLLPKSQKAVVVEEGVRQLKAEPTQWKERARLPAKR